MVKFGVSIPTGREGLMVPTGFASRETIIEAGKRAEELGYYSVWGNDHITTQNYIRDVRPKPSFYEPLISLAAVAAVTKKGEARQRSLRSSLENSCVGGLREADGHSRHSVGGTFDAWGGNRRVSGRVRRITHT